MFYIGLNEASDGYLLELVIFLIICIVILHVLSVLLCQFLSILVSGLDFKLNCVYCYAFCSYIALYDYGLDSSIVNRYIIQG